MDSSKIQSVKQQFGIIGNDPELLRAIDTAIQVAHTDLSVLITGESGVGKEYFPQIIHQNSVVERIFTDCYCTGINSYGFFYCIIC